MLTVPTQSNNYNQQQHSYHAMSFDPSASTRSLSGPQAAPSAVDSLPNINFGFDELRERMVRFTGKFDTFIEGGRKNVLEERNQFHMRIGEIRGLSGLQLSAIASCRVWAFYVDSFCILS